MLPLIPLKNHAGLGALFKIIMIINHPAKLELWCQRVTKSGSMQASSCQHHGVFVGWLVLGSILLSSKNLSGKSYR